MNRIYLLIEIVAAAALVSTITVWACHKWGRGRLWVVAAGAVVVFLIYVFWDRAQKAGTPFRYEEPRWFTALVGAIPIMVIAGVVQWEATRKRHIGWQILIATVAGVVAFYAVAVLLYAALVSFL